MIDIVLYYAFYASAVLFYGIGLERTAVLSVAFDKSVFRPALQCGVSALAATEAFAQSFGRRHAERGRLLVVEGTEAYIVHTAFAQGDEVRYDIYNLSRIQNPVYGGLVYHACKGTYKIGPCKEKNARAGVRAGFQSLSAFEFLE